MTPPRRPRFRRPPPPDPYRVDLPAEERIEEEVPSRFGANVWLVLALLGIGVAATAIILVAVLATRDEGSGSEPRPRPERVAVPLAVGADYAQASSAIEALGLVADGFPVASEQPAGRVLDQSPAAGTRLRRGGSIRLDVSLGPAPLPVTPVPNVARAAALAARAELRRAGFTVRSAFGEAPSADASSHVLRQDPEPGALAPGLTQVTIVVGR